MMKVDMTKVGGEPREDRPLKNGFRRALWLLQALWKSCFGYRPERRYMRGDKGGTSHQGC